MRRLMLLRHAKSDWSSPGMQDRDRPLNRRGQTTAPKIGAYMARSALVPDLIICSPAKRTRETFELVTASFPKPPQSRFEERLYGAGPDLILDLVRQTPQKVHSLLL